MESSVEQNIHLMAFFRSSQGVAILHAWEMRCLRRATSCCSVSSSKRFLTGVSHRMFLGRVSPVISLNLGRFSLSSSVSVEAMIALVLTSGSSTPLRISHGSSGRSSISS